MKSSQKKNLNNKIVFLGRGHLGLEVLNGLLDMNNVDISIIFICEGSVEVGFCNKAFQDISSKHNIPIFFENNINKDWIYEKLRSHSPELIVAMLWLHTINRKTVESSRLGILNLHAGDLPRYRGNACQTWAILNEEEKIGVSVHLMEGDSLDSGPVVLKEHIPVTSSTTVGELIGEVNRIGPGLVLKSVRILLKEGAFVPEIQDETNVLHCFPRIPSDGEIDWNMTAWDINKLVRAAGSPYPGAYSWFSSHLEDGKVRKLVVHKASIAKHPLNDFCAVPGHVIKLKNGDRIGVACGDKKLIILDHIEIDGETISPISFFRSVRQRLGLDIQTEVAKLKYALLEVQSNRASTASAGNDLSSSFKMFMNEVFNECEKREIIIKTEINRGYKKIASQGIKCHLNEFRNYSFQKRFYDWEQRERWFGIQIYQSVKIDGKIGSVNIGLWFFSEGLGDVEERIYLSCNQDISGECAVRRNLLSAFLEESIGLQKQLWPNKSQQPLAMYYIINGESTKAISKKIYKLAKRSALILNNIP